MAYLPPALIISMLHSLNFGKLRSLLSTLIYICSAPVFLIQLFTSCISQRAIHSSDASVERKTIHTPTKPRGNSMSWGRSLAFPSPTGRIPHDCGRLLSLVQRLSRRGPAKPPRDWAMARKRNRTVIWLKIKKEVSHPQSQSSRTLQHTQARVWTCW